MQTRQIRAFGRSCLCGQRTLAGHKVTSSSASGCTAKATIMVGSNRDSSDNRAGGHCAYNHRSYCNDHCSDHDGGRLRHRNQRRPPSPSVNVVDHDDRENEDDRDSDGSYERRSSGCHGRVFRNCRQPATSTAKATSVVSTATGRGHRSRRRHGSYGASFEDFNPKCQRSIVPFGRTGQLVPKFLLVTFLENFSI